MLACELCAFVKTRRWVLLISHTKKGGEACDNSFDGSLSVAAFLLHNLPTPLLHTDRCLLRSFVFPVDKLALVFLFSPLSSYLSVSHPSFLSFLRSTIQRSPDKAVDSDSPFLKTEGEHYMSQCFRQHCLLPTLIIVYSSFPLF